MRYQTKDGDVLDRICHDQYGFTDNAFETVLYAQENNDKTATAVFDAGVTLELPPIAPAKKQTETLLWE